MSFKQALQQVKSSGQANQQAALQQMPTDFLLQAYANQRNPWAYEKAAANNGYVAQELARRGVSTQGIQVTPSGKVHHPGLRGIGESLAPILKVAAPIAALAIPGLGPIAAGAIAAGGNELGNVLQGKNALRALPGAALTGLATGAGRAALGALSGAAGGAAGSAAEGAGGGGLGGTLKSVGQGLGVLTPTGGLNPLRLAQLGLGAAGLIQGAQAQGRANQQIGRAVAPINIPMPDLTPIPGAPFNPYSQNYQGPGSNGAQLAALRSLAAR